MAMDNLSDASMERSLNVRRVMWIVLFLNLGVALAKIICGVTFGSASVKADGIHSVFDAASNIVGLLGLFAAARPADESHPYGHGKYETFASTFIGVLLLVAACEVGLSAVQSLLSGESDVQTTPISFIVMVVTICVNIGVTTYERRMGKRYNSALLGADAKHTLSDVLVSASVIVGLAFVAAGFPIADSIAALVVTVAIFAAAVSVFKEVHDTFSDEARIDVQSIADCVMGIDEVRSCHHVRTRGMQGEVYADLHVLVDPTMPILQAHEVADEAERRIEEKFSQVKEVLVHLEPDTPIEREEISVYDPRMG